jgi:putative transposon-encoded protein
MGKIQNRKGLLILEKVEFNKVAERIVIKNNDSSGKVTLPKDWINKKVFVVLKEVKKDE